MKFYFGVNYEERLGRCLMGALSSHIKPLEVFVLCDNGQVYRQQKFGGFGSQAHFDRFWQFIHDNGDGLPTEMIGWCKPAEYVALLAAVDGPSHHESMLPANFTNLGQSLIEYMDYLEDSDFGVATDFRYVAVMDRERGFTPKQKLEMFLSHRNCPQPHEEPVLVDRVRWYADVYAFFQSQKDLKITLSQIPELPDADANDNY